MELVEVGLSGHEGLLPLSEKVRKVVATNKGELLDGKDGEFFEFSDKKIGDRKSGLKRGSRRGRAGFNHNVCLLLI